MSEWPTVPFGRLALSMRNGLSPSRNGDVQGEVLTLSAVTQGGFDPSQRKDATFGSVPGDDQVTRPGMFLMCRGNGNIGLVGAGVVVPNDAPEVVYPDTVIGAVLDLDAVDPGFLAYAWSTPIARGQIEAGARTTNGTHKVNQQLLESIEIPLPPLPEQRRIAAILDEADALRRKRREALGLLDELLRSAFLEMFGDIPAGRSPWPWGTCADATTMSSGKSSKAVLSREPTDVPVYGGNGVNGYATEALFDEPVIVVGRVGQQCGITHLTSGPSWVTDNAIVVRVTDSSRFDPVYLATAFQHAPIRDTVTRLDLPFINQDMLRELAIPLPPIDVQRRYVALRAAAQEEAARAEAALLGVSGLFEALLHRAFTGVL